MPTPTPTPHQTLASPLRAPARQGLLHRQVRAGAACGALSLSLSLALSVGLCLGLALAAAPGTALAERADRDKPMNIESDALRYDDVRQTSIFTGNVVLTKGTIVLRGGQLDVTQDGQGNQVAVVLASPNALAFFRQKRDNLNEFIEAEAQRIDYDSRTETVKLTGQAVFRRYRGAQLNDETTGTIIVYDGRTEVFTVQGGGGAGTGNATAANPSGRVRALITPNNNPATDPANNSTPNGTAPAAGPALQPSLNLGPRQ